MSGRLFGLSITKMREEGGGRREEWGKRKREGRRKKGKKKGGIKEETNTHNCKTHPTYM